MRLDLCLCLCLCFSFISGSSPSFSGVDDYATAQKKARDDINNEFSYNMSGVQNLQSLADQDDGNNGGENGGGGGKIVSL